MKFKDLIPLIPTIDIVRIYRKSGTNIIFEGTIRKNVDLSSLGERTIAEIRICSAATLTVIFEK